MDTLVRQTPDGRLYCGRCRSLTNARLVPFSDPQYRAAKVLDQLCPAGAAGQELASRGTQSVRGHLRTCDGTPPAGAPVVSLTPPSEPAASTPAPEPAQAGWQPPFWRPPSALAAQPTADQPADELTQLRQENAELRGELMCVSHERDEYRECLAETLQIAHDLADQVNGSAAKLGSGDQLPQRRSSPARSSAGQAFVTNLFSAAGRTLGGAGLEGLLKRAGLK